MVLNNFFRPHHLKVLFIIIVGNTPENCLFPGKIFQSKEADLIHFDFQTSMLLKFALFQQGITLLWLTAMIPWLKPPPCDQLNDNCNSATPAQLAVLFTSLGLISVGAGCIRPCSIAFGADQLDNKENPDNDTVLQSFFNWYYASIGVSTVIALTFIAYIQDHLGWKFGFGVPVILMVFSALMFVLGSSLYIRVKPGKNLLTGFVQILVVAFKNRCLTLPTDSVGYYNHSSDPKFLAPTSELRYSHYQLHDSVIL